LSISDQKIIQEIKNGDPMGVMQHLYDHQYPKLKTYILRNSGSEEDAQDIFQETVMKLFSHIKLGKFKPEYEIGGFMYIVGANAWKRKNKGNIHHADIEKIDPGMYQENQTYDKLFDKDKKRIINEFFDKVGENCKALLKLVIFYKMSLKEVSEKLGYSSVDTAKTRHYKCKQKLIKIIKDQPEYGEFIRRTLTHG
jgi:RNA polymerase sigma factor (sigma-70 family)